MAMNSSFFLFFLLCIPSTVWCFVEGSCPEETCFSLNRETCEFGTNVCGECFPEFLEVGKKCIASESQNDEDWENDLKGTDGDDLQNLIDKTTPNVPTDGPEDEKLRTLLFSPTASSDFIPSSAPATGVNEEENESSNKNNDLEPKVAYKKAEELSKPKGKASKLTTGIGNVKPAKNINKNSDSNKIREKNNKEKHGVIPPIKRKEKIEAGRSKQKKREDEAKLDKFLLRKEKKEGEKLRGKVLSQEHNDINLEANSSQNPPPFISKHKVGKTDDARASELDDIYFLFIVIGCSVAGIAGLALAGYCWYKLHTTAKAVSEAEYSGHGMKSKHPPSIHGDEKLDYSAEMYHYHQTKSQLAAMEKASGSRSSKQGSLEDEENSDEGDEGDYTVYECPGLAPAGDMTVVNPLFSDQEVIGSDQDGNRSSHSSPGISRHSTTTKPE